MAHHVAPDGSIYVDTAFINASKRLKGVRLEHMGFGEFYLETNKGRVDFDRMRGKDFPGQSGRSHKFYDEKGGNKVAMWIIEQMERHGHSDRVASMNLRKAVIRLAHENPELRKDLLPLLAKKRARVSDVEKKSQADLYQRLQSSLKGVTNERDQIKVLQRLLTTWAKNWGLSDEIPVSAKEFAEEIQYGAVRTQVGIDPKGMSQTLNNLGVYDF